jgi:hypothetical protein
MGFKSLSRLAFEGRNGIVIGEGWRSVALGAGEGRESR